jgi:formylglycine-generating enzyme required for sulfatase activity
MTHGLLNFEDTSCDAEQIGQVQIMDSDDNNNGSLEVCSNAKQFRVFLASPGDVPLERKLARETIIHIGSERRFRGRINIEIIAWDQPGAAVAMEAGLTPQEAIAQGLPKPEDCDLAVIVLWSRIGTPLPADFELKSDSTPYLSGTEWEYLNALKGYRKNRRPAVWVYRRKGAPNPDLDDPNYASIVEQWNKLQKFFATFRNPDGSLKGGINHYESPDDFRQQFEHHLRDRFDKLLEMLPNLKTATTAPIWTDSPYPGLKAFIPEQAPIYFGRGSEIDQLLQQFSNPKVRFVAVVGVSGSGKSSLIMAGLLLRLRTGIVGNAPWIDLIFKPGERGGSPFLAMAFAIKTALAITDQTEQELARALQADPAVIQNKLTELLAPHKSATELLLVVDQFEELFTQSKMEERRDFLKLLDRIVEQPRIRVIVTLRADFYAQAIEQPILARLLRRDRGTFPLDPPDISAIYQMIIRPAEVAGIELQNGLAQRLLEDAGEGPGAMPLIAFTLSQLYRQDKDAGMLSIDAYEAFGGVQGAVQQRAEASLQGLTIDLDNALPRLFAHLVEVNEQEVATRRRALQSRLKGDVKTAADALTEARLLVTGKGKNDQPTLEVAHETVLNGWDRLRQWIRDHAESLRARRDLERVAVEWDKSGRHVGALRTGKLLQRYLSAAEPRSTTADAYLAVCKRHRMRIRVGFTVLGLLAVAVLGILFHINKSHYPPTLAAKALFVQLGLWPVSQPNMVTIRAGDFEMGDLSGDGQTDERPVHTVRFAKAFEMGKFEVTFEEYDLFAAATGRYKPSDEGWGRGDRPVINISWKDATAYAQWFSKRTGLKYRLPSEAEWEYAARAHTRTSHYWEEATRDPAETICNYANLQDRSLDESNYYLQSTKEILKQQGLWAPVDCNDGYINTALVGSFQANAFDLYDMSGNVWEWVRDCYQNSYEHAPDDGSAFEQEKCSLRVLRGGSWDVVPQYVRSANRDGSTPVNRIGDVGFRLARTL